MNQHFFAKKCNLPSSRRTRYSPSEAHALLGLVGEAPTLGHCVSSPRAARPSLPRSPRRPRQHGPSDDTLAGLPDTCTTLTAPPQHHQQGGSPSGFPRNGIYLVYTWYIPGIDQCRRYRRYIGGIYQVNPTHHCVCPTQHSLCS